MMQFIVALLLMVGGGGAIAYSESPQRLTVDDAVEIALANNLDLEREGLSLELRRLTRDRVYNRFFPTIRAGGTLTFLNEPVEVGTPDGLAEGPNSNLSFNLSAQIDLSLQLIGGIRHTQLDYEAGLISLERARQSLERNVRLGFYNLLLLRDSFAISEESVELARQRYEQAQINHRSGIIDEFALLSAQVAFENSKPPVEDLRLQIDTMRRQFLLNIGLDIDTQIELDGSIAPDLKRFDSDIIVEQLLSSSLDLQALNASIRISENNIELTKQEFLPILSLGYQLMPLFLGDPFEDQLFENTSDNWTLNGGLSITITQPLDPLLPASQTRTTLKSQQIELRQARLQTRQTMVANEIQTRQLLERLEQIRTGMVAKELNVAVAERAFDLAQSGYNAGVRELLEVRNAENDLLTARFELLEEQFNWISTLLDLRFLLGIGPEELQRYASE